jgi:uncharacterized membrane protein YcaP (DUF421 family)
MVWTDLLSLLRFDVDPIEIVVRVTLVYWFLFLLLRFVLRRGTGSIGLADILLLVLIADASQNAMAGGYETVADGLLLVATIAGWNWAMDWAGFRFEAVRRLLEPAPVLLVSNGRLHRRNLRREMITDSELMQRLRENGIEQLTDVKSARMEGDGEISVIALTPKPAHPPSKKAGGRAATG